MGYVVLSVILNKFVYPNLDTKARSVISLGLLGIVLAILLLILNGEILKVWIAIGGK